VRLPEKQRQIETKSDPERHGQTQQFRRIHEIWHHRDGRNRADDGAEHTIEGF
jgi:hypothetical protein